MALSPFLTTTPEKYAWSRPGYSDAPVIAAMDLLGKDRLSWLDLAAGTGAFSSMLLNAGQAVVALEPDRDMARFFSQRFPEVELHVGSGEEAADLIDQKFDVVSVAQALHYMDLERVSRSVQRLAGGGLFVVCSNTGSSEGWLAAVSAYWYHLSLYKNPDPVAAAGSSLSDFFGEPDCSLEEVNSANYTWDRAWAFIESLSNFQTESAEVKNSLQQMAENLFKEHSTPAGNILMSFAQSTNIYRVP